MEKRMIVTKKVMLDTESNWTNATKSWGLLHVDHIAHKVAFCVTGGANPLWRSVFNLLLSDKDAREELEWGAKYKRRDTALVEEYNGDSGNYRATLYTSHLPEWAAKADRRNLEKRAEIYFSCFDKMSGLDEMFSADLYALVVTAMRDEERRKVMSEFAKKGNFSNVHLLPFNGV